MTMVHGQSIIELASICPQGAGMDKDVILQSLLSHAYYHCITGNELNEGTVHTPCGDGWNADGVRRLTRLMQIRGIANSR